MAEQALASGSPANNPRAATAEEILQLYKAAWAGGQIPSSYTKSRGLIRLHSIGRGRNGIAFPYSRPTEVK